MHIRRSEILDITSNYVGIFGNNINQQQQPEEEEEKKKAGEGAKKECMVMTRTVEKEWS